MSTASSERGGLEAKLAAPTTQQLTVDRKGVLETESSDVDESTTCYSDNPFEDPNVAEHWKQVYEASRYECREEYDPKFTWTAEEEKRLVRKLDVRVCLWAVSGFTSDIVSI
jgi:hypothetical protein